MSSVEIWLSDSLLAECVAEKVDDSFDHSFGVRRVEHIEVRDVRIFAYSSPMEWEITDLIREKYPSDFSYISAKLWEAATHQFSAGAI